MHDIAHEYDIDIFGNFGLLRVDKLHLDVLYALKHGMMVNVANHLGLDICGSLPLEEGGTAEDAAVNRRTDSFIVEALKDRLI